MISTATTVFGDRRRDAAVVGSLRNRSLREAGRVKGIGRGGLLLGGALGLAVSGAASAQFAFPNATLPMDGKGIAVGDVNGDGVSDFVTADWDDGRISVALRGSAIFDLAHYPAGDAPSAVALGDVDGDGDLDAVTTGAVCEFDLITFEVLCDHRASVLLNNGNGVFGAPMHFLFRVGVDGQTVTGVPSWVELGDLDGDGDLDMAVADGNDAAVVLFNDGSGAFGGQAEHSTGIGPNQVALGDLDSDGDLDMVVANLGSGDTSVFLNDGTGSFGPEAFFPSGTTQGALVLGDLNGDGHLDLVTAEAGGGSIGGPPSGDNVHVLFGVGDGSFGAAIPYLVKGDPDAANPSPIAVDLGDFNGDGHLDIAAVNQFGEKDAAILINAGDGSFAPVISVPFGVATSNSPEGGVVTDIDGNGTDDILRVISGVSGVSAVFGKGDGTFWRPGSHPLNFARALDGADVDDDGDTDIIGLTDLGAESVLLVNDGSGDFAGSPLNIKGTGVRFADMDGDGDPDYVFAGPSTVGGDPPPEFNGMVAVAFNDGGTFGAPVPHLIPAWGKIAIADLNGDARPDVVVFPLGPVSVLLNQGGGTLGAPVTYFQGEIVSGDLGDIDNDGDIDIVLGQGNSVNATPILINAGDGTFTEAADASPITGAFVSGDVALTDLDEDGNLDVVVPNGEFFANQLLFRYGNGDGTFAPAVAYAHSIGGAPEHAKAVDLNQDGLIDLVISVDGELHAIYNLGARAFAPPVRHDTPANLAQDIFIGDLTGDGTPDAATATWFGDTIEIMPNVMTPPGNPADLNSDGVVDVFDLLVYLDLWFASDPAADLDGNGPVDVFDLLAYLDLWFAS